jgi:hypothetical protein
MKKISLLKNMLFREAPYAFKEPGEQNLNLNMLQMGIMAIIKKFDKTGSVHNVIRKNKEPSQKKKNVISKLKMVISEDPSLSIRHLSQVAEIKLLFSTRWCESSYFKKKPKTISDPNLEKNLSIRKSGRLDLQT